MMHRTDPLPDVNHLPASLNIPIFPIVNIVIEKTRQLEIETLIYTLLRQKKASIQNSTPIVSRNSHLADGDFSLEETTELMFPDTSPFNMLRS
jgi:hypothetical protein